MFQRKLIFGLAKARCCITLDARSSPRRWMTVTLSANRVRKRASSRAESPPPTTAIFLPEEETVAGGAGGDAVAQQPLLVGEVEHQGLGPGGDDQCVGGVGRLVGVGVADPEPERPVREVDPGDLGREELGPEAGRLLAEGLHELGAHDPLDEARVVLDVGGEHELAARAGHWSTRARPR